MSEVHDRNMLRREYRCGFHLTARIVAWWWRRQGFETNIEKVTTGYNFLSFDVCFIVTGHRTEYPDML